MFYPQKLQAFYVNHLQACKLHICTIYEPTVDCAIIEIKKQLK